MSDIKKDQTWTTKELQEDFTVLAFSYGCVEVIHKESGKKGTLEFGGSPRIYDSFIENE